MDDKFRLVFAWTNRTPTAQDYLAPEAAVFSTLREAVIAAHRGAAPKHMPFIAHRHVVFDSLVIEILHAEFVAAAANA